MLLEYKFQTAAAIYFEVLPGGYKGLSTLTLFVIFYFVSCVCLVLYLHNNFSLICYFLGFLPCIYLVFYQRTNFYLMESDKYRYSWHKLHLLHIKSPLLRIR